MQELKTLEDLQKFISSEGIKILEVGSRTCSPCFSLKIKISEWLKSKNDVLAAFVLIDDVPEISGLLSVYSAPSVLVYLNDKLSVKESGYFSLEEILGQVERSRELFTQA